MILLYKTYKILNLNFCNIKFKYWYNFIFLKGFFGCLKFSLMPYSNLYIQILKLNLHKLYYEVNTGWIGILFLNGLGFKATRKYILSKYKYWRFNVGHSHVFLYFTPRKLIFKAKKRYICLFGYKKNQIFDITEKLKKFHISDVYKGVGIKYPDEVIKLKKGKVRQ